MGGVHENAGLAARRGLSVPKLRRSYTTQGESYQAPGGVPRKEERNGNGERGETRVGEDRLECGCPRGGNESSQRKCMPFLYKRKNVYIYILYGLSYICKYI